MVRFALAIGVVALAGCATSTPPAAVSVAASDDPYGLTGTLVESGYDLPDVTLTDTAGRSYSLVRDTTKPVTVIFFMYAHCPDVCPTTLADIAAALRRLDADVADRSDVDVIAITTDPKRDTPDVMKEYLSHFDPSFIGLTGELGEIETAAAALGIALTGENALPGGGYEVGHGAQIIGFGPPGAVVWSEGSPVGVLRADIELLLEQA